MNKSQSSVGDTIQSLNGFGTSFFSKLARRALSDWLVVFLLDSLSTSLLDFRFFSQILLSELLIHSFPLSDLSESLMVAHLSWSTWALRSRLLISSEWPERFAHSRSFVLSDLSKSLKVAHSIWAKWANERMSEFPAQKSCNTVPLTSSNHFMYSFYIVHSSQTIL